MIIHVKRKQQILLIFDNHTQTIGNVSHQWPEENGQFRVLFYTPNSIFCSVYQISGGNMDSGEAGIHIELNM